MKLVERGEGHLSVVSETQRVVGQDLFGTAYDGSIPIQGDITGEHADVLAPQQVRKVKELLAHQSFYWSSVVHALSRAQCEERKPEGNGRLSAPSRGPQDHMVPKCKGQACVILMRPQVCASALVPIEKQRIGVVNAHMILASACRQFSQVQFVIKHVAYPITSERSMFISTAASIPSTQPPFAYCHITMSTFGLGTGVSYSAHQMEWFSSVL